MKLYHFTSLRHLVQIRAAGKILPTDSMLKLTEISHPMVVWLLDTETVDFPHGLDGAGSEPGDEWDKTRARITVDVPAIRWVDWAPAHGMNSTWRAAMVEAGGGEEAAAHWYVFPAAISMYRWLDISVDGESKFGEKVSSEAE